MNTSDPRSPRSPFGRALCAMVTPFTDDGALDLTAAQQLADRLVAEGCEGLVLSGTTGESPTTTDAEKADLVRAVREAADGRATVLAGVGTSDTRHTITLARQAQQAGADGLLVVTPYYSRPPQDAVEAHFRELADAVDVPVMLYDIPGRTGTRIEPETMIRLAAHPRIVAVKDCAYDLLGTQKVMAATDLAYYTGCDEYVLALYALGGAGYVSTVANAVPRAFRAIVDAYDAGNTAEAARRQRLTVPLTQATMNAGLPGTVTVKALLAALGLPGGGTVRAPLRPAGHEVTDGLLAIYAELVSASGTGATNAPGSRPRPS
ncbi:4-hydroxy-tetrahydrodipicolinate synthase [Streptomyces sp. NPDC046716]|uniref:4-hydroxy-tetrahydrodipicolinate synthase n=1 Tax=Streptomyces sp. NPDC046716 TaxID=3157093 RepID=UPI0033D0F348